MDKLDKMELEPRYLKLTYLLPMAKVEEIRKIKKPKFVLVITEEEE